MTSDTLLMLLVGSMALPLAAAQTKAPSSTATQYEVDAGLKNELDSLAEKLAGIRDLSTDFEEKKFSALLKNPLVSKGTMRVVGTRSRWDTISPRPCSMTVDPAEIQIYYPERSTIEVYKVDEKLRWLTVWPLPRLSMLIDRFFIERLPVSEMEMADSRSRRLGLRLHPRDDAIAAHLRRVDAVLDTMTGLVVRVEILDADDDRTVITFSNTRLNSGIKESDLELAVPIGTQTVRPLAKLEQPAPGVQP